MIMPITRLKILMSVKKRKRTYLYIRWAYKQGGVVISGIIPSLENAWAYIRGVA